MGALTLPTPPGSNLPITPGITAGGGGGGGGAYLARYVASGLDLANLTRAEVNSALNVTLTVGQTVLLTAANGDSAAGLWSCTSDTVWTRDTTQPAAGELVSVSAAGDQFAGHLWQRTPAGTYVIAEDYVRNQLAVHTGSATAHENSRRIITAQVYMSVPGGADLGDFETAVSSITPYLPDGTTIAVDFGENGAIVATRNALAAGDPGDHYDLTLTVAFPDHLGWVISAAQSVSGNMDAAIRVVGLNTGLTGPMLKIPNPAGDLPALTAFVMGTQQGVAYVDYMWDGDSTADWIDPGTITTDGDGTVWAQAYANDLGDEYSTPAWDGTHTRLIHVNNPDSPATQGFWTVQGDPTTAGTEGARHLVRSTDLGGQWPDDRLADGSLVVVETSWPDSVLTIQHRPMIASGGGMTSALIDINGLSPLTERIAGHPLVLSGLAVCSGSDPILDGSTLNIVPGGWYGDWEQPVLVVGAPTQSLNGWWVLHNGSAATRPADDTAVVNGFLNLTVAGLRRALTGYAANVKSRFSNATSVLFALGRSGSAADSWTATYTAGQAVNTLVTTTAELADHTGWLVPTWVSTIKVTLTADTTIKLGAGPRPDLTIIAADGGGGPWDLTILNINDDTAATMATGTTKILANTSAYDSYSTVV